MIGSYELIIKNCRLTCKNQLGSKRNELKNKNIPINSLNKKIKIINLH